jgi:hypothetical protein
MDQGKWLIVTKKKQLFKNTPLLDMLLYVIWLATSITWMVGAIYIHASGKGCIKGSERLKTTANELKTSLQ